MTVAESKIFYTTEIFCNLFTSRFEESLLVILLLFLISGVGEGAGSRTGCEVLFEIFCFDKRGRRGTVMMDS